jgi:hypothetical protein
MTISVSTTTGNREMCVRFWKTSSTTGAGSSVVIRQGSFLLSWENLKQWVLPFSKKNMSDFNSTIWSMYNIGHFLFTGAGWACGIPSVFTQIYLCFSAVEYVFSAMLDWRGCVFTQFCLWPGLIYLPLRFMIFGSLSSLYPGIVITLLRLCNYLK